MGKMRYFTLEEAEATLPAAREMLEKARDTKIQIEAKVDEWRRRQKALSLPDEAIMRGQVEFLAQRLDDTLAKMTELGCVPKDLEAGLIDFPARVDGKEGFFCWKEGESRIAYWHGLTEGFAGRQPLQKDGTK